MRLRRSPVPSNNRACAFAARRRIAEHIIPRRLKTPNGPKHLRLRRVPTTHSSVPLLRGQRLVKLCETILRKDDHDDGKKTLCVPNRRREATIEENETENRRKRSSTRTKSKCNEAAEPELQHREGNKSKCSEAAELELQHREGNKSKCNEAAEPELQHRNKRLLRRAQNSRSRSKPNSTNDLALKPSRSRTETESRIATARAWIVAPRLSRRPETLKSSPNLENSSPRKPSLSHKSLSPIS